MSITFRPSVSSEVARLAAFRTLVGHDPIHWSVRRLASRMDTARPWFEGVDNQQLCRGGPRSIGHESRCREGEPLLCRTVPPMEEVRDLSPRPDRHGSQGTDDSSGSGLSWSSGGWRSSLSHSPSGPNCSTSGPTSRTCRSLARSGHSWVRVLVPWGPIAVLFTASYQDRTYELARPRSDSVMKQPQGFLALLSTEEGSGKKPTAAQYVGVILACGHLSTRKRREESVSVAIDGGDLPPSALALLLDAPLRSSEEHDQRVGSRLLLMAAGELTDDTTGAFDWPEVLSQWPAHFPREAQVNVLAAIGRTLASQPLLFWHSRRDWAAYLLDEALISTTSDDGVKDSAYLLQCCLLRSFERGLTSHLNRGEERRGSVTFVDNADDYHLVGRYDASVKRGEEAMKSKWADDRTVANGDQ